MEDGKFHEGIEGEAVTLFRFESEEIGEILHKQAMGLDNGVYFPAAPAVAELNRKVEVLGAAHTTVIGARTLDILHVAQALVMKSAIFLSVDTRQSLLAREAGLRVPKLLVVS